MTTTCASCGAATRGEDRFCPSCGTDLSAQPPPDPGPAGFCTTCGEPLDQEDRFCGRCGAPARPRVADGLGEGEPGPDVGESDEDLLADWEIEVPEEEAPPPMPPDQAVTESVPVSPPAGDTAVIEQLPQVTPQAATRPPPVTPPPRAGETPARGFPAGATFALVGAVAVIVSAVLEWGGPFRADLPRDIAFRLLFDPAGPSTGLNLGVVLLGTGTLGALVAILTMAVPAMKPVRRVIGLLTLAIPAGFAVRTFQLALDTGGLLDLPTLLGPGVYVAILGGLVELVAGRWFRR